MEKEIRKPCLRCFGEGIYSGVYGRTVCGDCDGTGKVSPEKRKEQLKKNRVLSVSMIKVLMIFLIHR